MKAIDRIRMFARKAAIFGVNHPTLHFVWIIVKLTAYAWIISSLERLFGFQVSCALWIGVLAYLISVNDDYKNKILLEKKRSIERSNAIIHEAMKFD